MATPEYFGSISTALIEVSGSPQRSASVRDGKDQVTRRYKCRASGITSSIPAYNSADTTYTTHLLTSFQYNATGEGDLYDVTLVYETDDSLGGGGLNPDAPLPPDELEYIAGTTERHIGSHPEYDPAWLGNPKSLPPGEKNTSATVDDPRGQPTTEPTKPGVEAYLIPTGVLRKTTYSHTKPFLNNQAIATRNIPTGEAGENKWLYTGYTLKITKGVYQLSQEWTYLPIGTWDTDIYD